ncbi:MAG TPA: hypothetical protein VHA11_10710, partial [Bryobacteraceae bacterium]|nr:hypothetical protein [Bryobacteraceae bacterium]
FPAQTACQDNHGGEPIEVPDHPLVRETVRDCLVEAMDAAGLKAVIAALRAGEIETVARDLPEPSVFSHEILNANPYAFLDDAPLEERRTRAVQVRRGLTPDLASGIGALDTAAIAQVEAEAWPLARDADELHDALLTLVLLPPVPEWEPLFEELAAAHRVTVLEMEAARFWVAAERAELAWQVHREEAAAAEALRGWLESTGPRKASALAAQLALPDWLVQAGLARLEAEGQVLRGQFTPDRTGEPEWCNRRLLARIHRLTLGRLRGEIEPATTAEFLRFLARWQHTARGTQLHGVDGTLAIIRQLQGYEIAAGAWESIILPRRVVRYDPEFLDRLCLSGEVMWGRLSAHPAFDEPAGTRRVRPTRVAPLSLFLREDAPVLSAIASAAGAHPDGPGIDHLSYAAREVLEQIERRGASFFADLQRAASRLASEVEDALWELVAAGLVTADGFENLRSLLDPKRRRGEGRGRKARPRHAAGRWALLPRDNQAPGDAAIELFARQLLRRWGVVFRDLLARETIAPPWRDLLVALRRMENRGEIRGGRFAGAFVGEQFALPEALDLLRAVRRDPHATEPVEVAAADPLNLSGILLPGPRVSALSGERLTLVAART